MRGFQRAKWMASALLVLLVLAGCSGLSGKTPEEKRLTLYTSFSPDLYNPMAEAFTKATGIPVDIVFGGTGVMLQRIEAEKGNPQGDVMLGGGAESFAAFRANFEPYKIQEAARIPADLKAADGLWHAYNSLPMVLMVNTNLVPEAERPKGWADLLHPRFKGKIAMADAGKSGTAFVQVATMLTLFGRDDGKGWQAVEGLVANAKVLGSSSMPIKGVNDGEYAVGLTYEQGAHKYLAAGGPVALIYPQEGTAAIADAVAVIKGAPHPQNARRFVDWLFTREAQELGAQMGLRPARSDIAPPAGLKPSGQITFVQLDQAWVTANREAILARWKELISRQ